MKREWLPATAAANASLCVVMIATMRASEAQTWHWTYVTHTPNTPPVAAQSTVAVSANALRTAYTVPLQHRQVVIESCTADVRDVENAGTIRTHATSYLLIRFKPSRSAACASGRRVAVALPTDDDRYINDVAAAINRSCCSAAHGVSSNVQRTTVVAAAASPSASLASPLVPARLVKRGSSRLAIGQTGTALVRLTIAANGTPQEATIVTITNKQLSAAAIETAVSSTYVPAQQNGRAVAAKYVATFSFDGQDPALASVPVWKRGPAPSPVPAAPAAAAVPAAAVPAAAPSPAADAAVSPAPR
jgi:hypothetical protein